LTDNFKSFFSGISKEATKSDTKSSEIKNVDRKVESKTAWHTTLIDKIKSLLKTLMKYIQSLLKLKKEDETDNAYENAKNERDFISLFNMGNDHLEKKEFDVAIEAYNQALKIKEDEGVRFKLELAVLQKKNAEKQKGDKKEKKQEKQKKDEKKKKEDKE
jgi:tetratricopeptide (TPR) repeat protein